MFDQIQDQIEKDWAKFDRLMFDRAVDKIHDRAQRDFTKALDEYKTVEKQIETKTTRKAPLDNLWKFPCKVNDKTPVCKWRDPANQQKQCFDPKGFNTGIPTGLRNNLLVVDLDVKDDGVEEFKQYVQTYGQPKTLHVITPTGGEHYYFNYSHADPGTQQMIKSYLNHSIKFRGKGIDIRSEGGFIVGPPSVRDGRAYEVACMSSPTDIPPSLVGWLLEGSPTKKNLRRSAGFPPGRLGPKHQRPLSQSTNST